MNCTERMNERMHQYLDEELTAAERQDFEAHLAGCTACMNTFQALGSTIQIVKQTEWVKAPAGFTEQLMAQIEANYPPKRNWRVPVVKYVGIAAAVLLVFGTGVLWAEPHSFSFQASQSTKGLLVQGNKVIVPAGSVYNGDITIENGDVEVKGKVNGNVTALNGKVYVDRALGADISGETEEVDQALEKLAYYGKQLWHDLTQSDK